MPDDGLPTVLHLDCKPAVGGAFDQIVVADRPVAVEAEAQDVHDEGVGRHSRLNIEGTGVRIAAKHSPDVVVVGAAGVNGRSVDRISRFDGKDRRVEGRELAVEDGGGELMVLGRRGGTRRTKG